MADGTRIDYVIDGQNRRIAKLLNGQIVKKWLYQDQLNPVAELDSANNLVARYVYGTKANIPEYIVKNDITYKVISDHLGSVRMVINTSNGIIAQRIDYDTWGNQVSNLGSNISSLSFAGGLTDEHTSLVRFGARDYDATIGRWISKDPIGFGGGVSNLYEYCLNDPINSIDPSGLQGIFSGQYWKDVFGIVDNQYIERVNENPYREMQRNANRESFKAIEAFIEAEATVCEGALGTVASLGGIAATFDGLGIAAASLSATSVGATALTDYRKGKGYRNTMIASGLALVSGGITYIPISVGISVFAFALGYAL